MKLLVIWTENEGSKLYPVVFYEHENQKGLSLPIELKAGCINLPGIWYDHVSSVDFNHAACVILFSEESCKGRGIRLESTKKAKWNLNSVDFNDSTKSARKCHWEKTQSTINNYCAINDIAVLQFAADDTIMSADLFYIGWEFKNKRFEIKVNYINKPSLRRMYPRGAFHISYYSPNTVIGFLIKLFKGLSKSCTFLR